MNHSPLSFYTLGTGRAGTAVSRWLRSHGHRLVGAWNRSEPRAQRAASLLNVRVDRGELTELPACGVVIVAVSDAAIAQTGRRLAPLLHPPMVAFHLSGSLAAGALGDLGVPRASVHPLVALSDADTAQRSLDEALFTLEGDAIAVEHAERMLAPIGVSTQRIAPPQKVRYHAAAVMASNLVVALVAEAAALAREAGVKNAEGALAQLARSALDQTLASGAAAGLTGPLRRGDIQTVKRHLETLDDRPRSLYLQLSRRALTLAEEDGLEPDLVKTLDDLLRPS